MGRPLAHVPDPAGDGHARYARHFAQALHRHLRRPRHPSRPLLLDERHLPDRGDGPVHPDRARPRRRSCARSTAGSPTSSTPTTGTRSASSARTAARSGRRSSPTGTARRSAVECRPDLVDLGARLRLRRAGSAPFGGAAKLPWNLEWAAQWRLFGVTIEPCGKDLSTAGGSRDRSDAIAREVFEREPPLNVPYEFLNIGGKKMSTSKGRGAAAHTIAEVIPPEQLRFLFLRPRPNQAIEFDPEGTDAIPRLFDEFDRFAAATAGREVKGELPPGYEAIFRYSLLDPDADVAAEAAALPARRSRHLALLVQVPGVDVAARVEAEKGEPADRARGRRSSRNASRPPAPGSRRYAPGARPDRGPARRAARPRSAALDARAAGVPRGARRGRRTATRRASGERGRPRSSPRPRIGLDCRRPAFAALYLAFLGRTERPARRLAARQPRPGLRRRPAARGRGRRPRPGRRSA